MSRLLRVIVAFVSVMSLCACGSDAVKIVKEGTLEKDKSVTVGNVLDRYKFFSEKEWKDFHDEQKRKIVQFTGTYDVDACSSVLSENNMGNAEILKFKNIRDKKIKIQYIAQFALHQDGKGFDLKYSGISGSKSTGEPFSVDDTRFAYINNVYGNTLPVDVGQAFILIESELMVEADRVAKASTSVPQQPKMAPQDQASSDPCANPQTTIEMKECESSKLDKADAELNAAYKNLQASLPDDRKAALKKEQIAWIKEKEAKCKPDPDGGTLAGLTALGCLREMTEMRILKLKEYAR